MEDSRFDALVRRLGGAGSRRPVLSAGLGALAALGASVTWPLDGEARRKKKGKKKKKKHHKGNNTRPTTTSTTTKAPPACPAGQKRCEGSCIDDVLCCDDGDCGAGQTCPVAGDYCLCTDANTITCGRRCCNKASEICRSDGTCVAGTCPATNYCQAINGAPQYLCANGPAGACVCTDTEDLTPQHACVAIDAIYACDPSGTPCGNSSQCPTGSVCIRGGQSCPCLSAFCAQLCTV